MAASRAVSSARTVVEPKRRDGVREWLDSSRPDVTALWAYGDSPGDRELLASADYPVWVDRARLSVDVASMRTL